VHKVTYVSDRQLRKKLLPHTQVRMSDLLCLMIKDRGTRQSDQWLVGRIGR
jgi:hypothetical protein